MEKEPLKKIILAVAEEIAAHEQELTQLDQATGDGDFGSNIKRGVLAIADAADEIAALPFPAAMQKMGMLLVTTVGGSSGPLYGSLLMAMGKAAAKAPENAAELAKVFAAGIESVKARGKADVGQKTMLDVLVPVLETLEQGGGDLLARIRQTADEALEKTKSMRATKGRAASLGDRSIGHWDPGARASQLAVEKICDVLEGKA